MYRDPAEPPRPPVVLYDGNALGIATFLGSPLGASILWALNERRAGRPDRAWKALGTGLAFTIALMVIGRLMPPGATIGVTVGAVFAARRFGDQWLARATAENRIGEVIHGSNWKAMGVGLASLVFVFGAILGGAAWAPDSLRGRVSIGPHGHVYYDEGVSRAEAQRLGERLRSVGFFQTDRTVDVRYARTPTGHALSFVVDAHAHSHEEMSADFAPIAHTLQPFTDPHGQLDVRLCDAEWHPHDRFTAP